MVIEKGVRNNGLIVVATFIRSSHALSDVNSYIRKTRDLFRVLNNLLEPLICEYFSRIYQEN
jgi:hypothetical protein